ncbi:MAG: NAD(P)/FAD-dependent oxidoreductase, partial [Rubrobacteraceae bacterium]
ILGGGFGGVAAAQELSKTFKNDSSVEITLVNRDNYTVFVPLLASAAGGSIESLHVVAPIRRLIPGARFRAEEITNIDLERKTVTTSSPVTGREHILSYDHLVIALGNIINLERLPGVAQHGMTVKTLGDALSIRNHVLQMLEAADIETDPNVRREMLTFVVAGGGFSGVETVGEMNDLIRDAAKSYPSITEEQIRVTLLHSRDRILPEMGPGIADYALNQLRKRGVEVRLNVRLAGATPHEVLLDGGSRIASRTLIVAVGNAPPPVLQRLDAEKNRGRIVVDEFMRLPGKENVWALGDNAIVPNRASKEGAPSPPTAQYAIRQGKALAKNIAAVMGGAQPKPFAFGGLGLLCVVGHGAGVGELPLGIKTKGLLGWILWRSVYWSKMPSFGRKVQIGVGWLLDAFLQRDIAQINL